MARVLAIGLGPLLQPGARHVGGQCLRTWHFVRPMLEAGHEVSLATCPVGPPEPAEKRDANALAGGPKSASADASASGPSAEPVERLEIDGFAYHAFRTRVMAEQLAWLNALLAREKFDAVVAINTYPAQLAADLATRLPVWADLNGWAMAEAQALALREGNEENLRWSWRQERTAVWRADRISTVSNAQRCATYGELAAMGRLGAAWSDPAMIAVVPNACAPLHLEIGREREELFRAHRPAPTPPGERADASLVWALWSGGFNVWTDAGALARGLEIAFDAEPRLRLAVTGGAIAGYHDATYDQFRAWVEANEARRSRVRLLGWLPAEEMARWHAAAHVGINFDAPSLEATFGARNRLTNMAAGALPVVSSLGAEVALDLRAARAGWFFAPGDAEGFGKALLDAACSGELATAGLRAREAALRLYADSHTVAPLLDWLRAPRLSADHAERQRLTPGTCNAWMRTPLNGHQRHELLWPYEDAYGLRRDAGDLARLRAKLPMRAWRGLKRLLGR
jgi:glycosyltransferase involved in cell wall biosynthesis